MNEIEELKNEIQKLKDKNLQLEETNENLEKRVYELEGKVNVLYKQYAARNREQQKKSSLVVSDSCIFSQSWYNKISQVPFLSI